MSGPSETSPETGAGPATLLSQLRLRPPVFLSADASVRDAARAMMQGGVSAVVLAQAGAVVTERDVVSALASGRAPTAPAASIANPDPLVISESASALEALGAMLQNGIRHLVVVGGSGRPRGMLTLTEAAAVVLGDVEVPPWLAGLRLALHVEMHVE
jgi:signal-transduction protein with cAMP-binding, CBS, and nucleotidyltransferase domain